MPDQNDLSGKVAFVSGASRGIGRAIAWALLRAGAKVAITSRKLDNIGPVGAEMNELFPGRALAIASHAGSREATQLAVAQAIQHFGRLDIAVNNAGTNPHFGPILTAEESHWDKILEVNVKGYFWLCRGAALHMRERGEGGKIINVASITGLEPGMMMGVYSVSKAAVLMLTKVMALELAGDDIQVNAVAPGFVKTKFSRALWDNPSIYASVVRRTPAGRLAEPDEISGIVLYLASEASDFTTGAVFTIDGGYTLT